MKLRLLPRAARDLAEIRTYIATDDPDAAAAVATALRKSLALIAERPDIGRPGATPDIREWSVPRLPYVVPYRVRGDHVEILRVWHTRRNRPSEW